MASGRMPVIDVRQTDARDYCGWLPSETGRHYRLPTEGEWEYACRAGAATAYPHGDKIGPGEAVYNVRKDLDAARPQSSHPVTSRMARYGVKEAGTLRPNRWGLFDMLGNVWEFTASRGRVTMPACPIVPSPADRRRS